MKFSNTERKFHPKSMTITFESQFEYDVFRDMLGYNVSIPKLVARATDKVGGINILGDLMTEFRMAMGNM